MTDQELERRLRAWYRAEIADDERAPTELRVTVAAAVRASSIWASRLRARLNLALVAAAAVAVLAVASLTLSRFAPSVGVGPTLSPAPIATQSPSLPPSPS